MEWVAGDWRKAYGFPEVEHLAETGVYPVKLDAPSSAVSCQLLLEEGKKYFQNRQKKPSARDAALWGEAPRRERILRPEGLREMSGVRDSDIP